MFNTITEATPKKYARHGRVFPERTLSPEELATRKAENEAFHKRCRIIFERVRPNLIEEDYGWYIAVEPDSGDYFIDANKMMAHQKVNDKHLNSIHCVFCLNETGATGRI